jgi:hypothetical protein
VAGAAARTTPPAFELVEGDGDMKGFIARAVGGLGLACGGLTAGAGCYGYKDLVDPCYPERYWYSSRELVREHLAPQVNNGHVLDQTVWNYHFEPGRAVLTPGGMEHLAYLARRRPCPDPTIYLQVAQDIPYDPGASDQFVELRNKLDADRIVAIQNYLSAQTAGRGVAFAVVRHDPADVGMSAVPAGVSIRQMQATAQGNLVRTSSGGGAAGPH